MLNQGLRHLWVPLVSFLACLAIWAFSIAQVEAANNDPLLVNVSNETAPVELTVNTSRVLTLGREIPKAQVNNPDIVELLPLSTTQVRLFAHKPGVTQVDLWDKEGHATSVTVVVVADAQQLEMLLKRQFPEASLKVMPVNSSVVISGYVERPDQVSRIVQMAQEFYPKVINNMTVAGVQQVALHVKVMEISRTKLRTLGVDWAGIHNSDFLVSGISGLIDPAAAAAGAVGATGDTVRFGIVNGNTKFFGFLNALQQNDLAKVLAEPTLVTVSGRPANFTAGGQIPILVPQSLGTVSIEYKTFGTQVDFVPIVLGEGRIHLDVRPCVSELDDTRGVSINGTVVPALKLRSVDTGVEMRAGQTLALAGLVQNRTEAETKYLPFLGEIPYLGAPFRKVTETNNEIELLILVRPELVAAMDPHEVPRCQPGMSSRSPGNWELYGGGHIEMPSSGPCAPPDRSRCGASCPPSSAPAEPVPADQARSYVAPVRVSVAAIQPPTAVPGMAPMPTPATYRQTTYISSNEAPMQYSATATMPQPAPPVMRPMAPAPAPQAPTSAQRPVGSAGQPTFIGPMGYDAR